MNRAIINKLVRKAPASLESSYIFVNDNRAICEAVITVGFTSLYVSRDAAAFLHWRPCVILSVIRSIRALRLRTIRLCWPASGSVPMTAWRLF